ncbi:MAG: hypothetical protein K8R90_09755 [Candidatus Cloacimonetes bacterium]|nr:hypothetical protein [Candidatus Cloacimonadota bacterium]
MSRALLTMLMLLPVLLCAQYDEKQILLQRAQGLEMRQMYEQANDVYAQLAQQYPSDINIINRWVRNLLRISQDDEAAAVLERHRERLPELAWTQLWLGVQLKAGNVEEARTTAWDFLKRHPAQHSAYKNFAAVFSGYLQPEEAIRLYLAGREAAGDSSLYNLELARTYQQCMRYEEAIDEYINHLAINPGYLHSVANQLRTMLDDDRRLLRHIERHDNARQEQVRELLALGYVYIGEMDKAFEVYDALAPAKLKRFADEQYAQDNLAVALRGYRAYIERENQPFLLADARLATARVYSGMGDIDSTRTVLLRLYHDDTLKERRFRAATRVNQVCREMLSDLAMVDGDYPLAERYLLEAVEFAHHPEERKLIELNMVRLQALQQRYEDADRRLLELEMGEEPGSKVETKALYIRWFSLFLQGDTFADSILNTMMVRDPGREDVNDALLLTLLCIQQGQHADTLRNAIRLLGLRKTADAVRTLLATGSPQLVLLGGDWALDAGSDDLARQAFARDFDDPDHLAYASLRLALLDDESARRERVIGFLNRHPQHPFSPLFRLLLRGDAPQQQ